MQHCLFVTYFDQQTGALHAIGWYESFLGAFKQVFQSFSVTNGKKKRKYNKNHQNDEKLPYLH